VLLGYTESFGNGKSDVWLLTIDGNGRLVNSRTYGGEERDYGTGLDITANGEYVLCGSVDGTFFIYYLNASQNIKWKHEWPKEDEEINIYDVKWTPDNEIVATGEYYGKYILVAKLNGNGDLLWQKHYLSEEYTQDTRRGNCINVTSDNAYIITGVGNTYKSRDNIGPNYEAILLKVTADGTMIWSKIIDRISVELFYRTFENSDHEIVAFGRTFDGADDEVGAWLAVFDQNGEMKREVLYGKYGFIFGNFCMETSNDRYILAGSTYNGNGCVMLVDKKGKRIW
ncbi:MAG: hypothetical protein GXO82_05430, partial [Chlorobi bacterium]|nr:hypothetical protein [Chlorobiota bacterium]